GRAGGGAGATDATATGAGFVSAIGASAAITGTFGAGAGAGATAATTGGRVGDEMGAGASANCVLDPARASLTGWPASTVAGVTPTTAATCSAGDLGEASCIHWRMRVSSWPAGTS